MQKSWITLGVLCVCVAALGLFVWLKPPKPERVANAVATLKTADARTLHVKRKDVTLATLEKRGNDWHLTTPIQAPADSFQVLRLLAVLDAKSAAQYPLADAGKFDLDTPQVELIINDQRFAFGTINNVTGEQYLLTQQQIFAVEPRFAAAIPANAAAIMRRSVLAAGDVPVRFDLGDFVVAHDGKKWSTTPAVGDISQDDYNRWVAQWREGSALRSEIAPHGTANRTVSITLKDGAKLALGLMQSMQSDAELVVHRADLGLKFVFTGDIGKQMIAPPAPLAQREK